MKKYILALAVCFNLVSCDDAAITVVDSIGKIKDVVIVVENDLWEGAVGDTLRNNLAKPVDGLIRDEPVFTLNQIKPASFEGLLKKSRNYIFVQLGKKESVSIRKDAYANPQTGVVITAPNQTALARLIGQNASNIIEVLTTAEITEKQRLMEKVRMDAKPFQDQLGISIVIPKAYRYAKTEKDFLWIRKTIAEGTMDLMFYEVPLEAIQRDSSVVSQIVRVRDSVGGKHIEVNEPGVFQTEPMFSPYLHEVAVAGQFAYETKGTWEVKNMFMAGPFVNYAIYNPKKKNWLIAEGYVSAPNSEQRNYMFELEAILKSIEFIDK